jgi:hypothetical protein
MIYTIMLHSLDRSCRLPNSKLIGQILSVINRVHFYFQLQSKKTDESICIKSNKHEQTLNPLHLLDKTVITIKH